MWARCVSQRQRTGRTRYTVRVHGTPYTALLSCPSLVWESMAPWSLQACRLTSDSSGYNVERPEPSKPEANPTRVRTGFRCIILRRPKRAQRFTAPSQTTTIEGPNEIGRRLVCLGDSNKAAGSCTLPTSKLSFANNSHQPPSHRPFSYHSPGLTKLLRPPTTTTCDRHSKSPIPSSLSSTTYIHPSVSSYEPSPILRRPQHLLHHPLEPPNPLPQFLQLLQLPRPDPDRTRMAAPRASSFKALRNLQRSVSAKRGLHMTGVHASPRPIDPSHKTTYMPWNLQDLRYECQKRTLSASGTKHELIDRLAGHDSLQARAFSIAIKRIAVEQTKKPVSG